MNEELNQESVSGNDVPVVVYREIDFSGLESEISDLHYQQAEIIEVLREYQELPRITPTILYSVTFILLIFMFIFRK